MEADFWHMRWQQGETAFHEAQGNALLIKHFSALKLAPASRIFVPLCGKTRDIHWLLAQGYQVVGAELSQIAIDALFTELGLTPHITQLDNGLQSYSAPNIEIWVGDLFAISADLLGPVAACYDRAALVALPAKLRQDYAAHLAQLTQQAPQLLITFEYCQDDMPGPPFSVIGAEVTQLYAKNYQITCLESKPLEELLKGKVEATEFAWYLTALK